MLNAKEERWVKRQAQTEEKQHGNTSASSACYVAGRPSVERIKRWRSGIDHFEAINGEFIGSNIDSLLFEIECLEHENVKLRALDEVPEF